VQIQSEVYRYQTTRQRLLETWPEIDCETLDDTL
jgi:hypothetical protein